MDINLIFLSINFILLGLLAFNVASLWGIIGYIETRLSHINTSLDVLDKQIETMEELETARHQSLADYNAFDWRGVYR